MLAIIVNLIRTKITAMLLGAEGVGIISIIDQVVQFAGYLSVFSLPFASVKFLSRSHSEGMEVFRRTYSSFLKALVILTATGTVVSIGLVIFRVELLGAELLRYRTFLIIALLAITANVLGGFFSNVLAAAQKPTISALVTVITGIVLTLTTYIGISTGGIIGLYLGNVLGGFFVMFGILIYLQRTLNLPLYNRAAGIFEELRWSPDIIPFSFMLYLAALTHSLSFLIARYSILKSFGEAETGLLQAGIAIAMSIGMVLGPANGLFLTPLMNRNIGRDEKIRMATEFQKKVIIILSIGAMPILLFPQWILTLLFTPMFTVAGKYVFLFVISQCLLQLAGVYQALIVGLDDLRTYAVITCTAHISLGLFSWILAPYYGIFGVSIGFIISSLFIYLMTFMHLRIKHGLSIPRSLGWLMIYSLLVMFLSGAVFSEYESRNMGIALLKVGIYLFFMVSLLFFLSKEERNSIYSLWDRFSLKPEET